MLKSTRNLALVGAGVTALIIGTFSVNAVADSRSFQHLKLAASDTLTTENLVHKAGWGERRHKRGFGKMTDEQIEKRVSRMVRHAAIELDATDEQTKQITAIATKTAKELKPLRMKMRETRKEIRSLLTAETVDRSKIEALRAARMADADSASKTVSTAIADVADILTPEQRTRLSELMDRKRGKRGWFGRLGRG